MYEINVVTGDLWNAGTEANVFISILGARGDTGSRQLVKSNKPNTFVKGQTDTFLLEAVHLGALNTVVIGHDGLEPGNGWYLEKVIVHDPVKDKEFIFFCYRWLDEGEEDGNIARQLYLTDEADFPARQELELKRKQLWNAEKWKYQKGNILQFYCKATRKFIRLTQDNKVDALGEKNDKYGFFEVIVKRGNVRVFNSHLIPNLAMAIDKEVVTAMHNSGILCELLVHLQLNRTVVLESTRVPGLTVSFGSDGNPSDGGTSGYAGISKEFVVHVKGIFQNGSIILMSTNWSQALCRRPDGRCSGAGIHNAESYWRVHKIDPAVCMFESVAHPQRYLQIKTGQCDGNGSGDDYCHFKVDKNLDNGSVTLESVRQSGIYIGLQSDGSTVPMVHTGDKNTIFYPKVIQFGKKKIKETPETPTQKEEIIRGPEDFVKAQRQVAWSSSTSASSNKIEPTRSECLEEDSHRLNEWMEWKVSVLTGSVGTGAKVSLWVYGSKGKAGPVTLENKGQGQIFQPQQEDTFMVKLPIIGKLYKIRIEHDGSSDQPEWNLQSVFLQKLKNGKTYYFEVNRWLSRNREDCEIMCEIPVTENGTFIYPIVKYQVKVYTGSFEKAGTDAPVYICIHGERGDTGKRILFKSGFQHLFQRGQLDVFQIEAVSLGKPEKVLLGCEANHKSQYWHCEKVIIREQGTDSEYIFNCERWLPFMSEGVLHSEIELLVKEMQIAPAARELTGEADGSWKITVITGNFQEAATDATVILYVYGDVTNSGPIILGSGGHQLFDTNSEDTFQVQLKHTGKPYKIRIGHDNSGENPNWYLEAVRLKNLWSEEEFYLPVNRWIGEENEDGATWREFALPINGNYTLKLLDYEVQVYSEATSSPDSESYLYINIFGSRGDSGKRKLYKPQNERRKVHNEQVDKFIIQAVSLGPVEKIQISRDRAGSGNSWFLDKLWILYTEDGTDHRILFPCSRWLDVNEDNEMTEIELFASKQENPEQEIKDKTWKIQIKTAKDSSPVKNMKVYIVIYGSEGKTDDLNLLPQDHGAVPFLPHAMDEFVVECRNVGEIFKIRVVCSDLPVSPGWHLKHLRMKELQSKEELYIDCNCWLSVETDGEDAVKEFPVDSNKHHPLPVYEYIVAVHIGGHWGAETSANVYLTLYGDHGDTGARKLHKSLSPGEKFARNKVDYFLLEAVSLGQLRKVALGHDGEGYGAGMYLKMVTVKQSNDSNNEWVFPCWDWLDNYLGICEMVCSLHTIGWRLSMDPNPIAQSGGLWIIDITGSEYDRSEISAQFDIWFYGDKDKEKVEAKIVGNALHIEESLQNIGSLQKVRFSWSNIQLKNAWHLSSLHLKNTVTNEEMQLTANCWMKPNKDNCIEIPAIYPNKDPLPVVDYTIYVYTGEMKNSNAAASVYISMEGEHGDTGYRALAIAGSDGLSFSNNQVDTFKIKAVHLGRLQRILVGYKSPSRDPWFLEKIVIKDATFSFTSFLFVHNDWLSCDQETESLEYVIPLKEMISEDSTVKTISTETKGKWIMQMQVSSTREENENINISVVVFGRTGKSPLFNIKKMGFDPFLLDVGDIGEIIKVSFLSTDQSHETKLQLHKVRMRDVDTKEEISFYPEDEWLPEKEPVIELPAILPNVPPLPVVSYSVRIRTGSIPASGTDADVFITVFGENGDTCKRKLQHSSFPSTFERGKVNVFDIKAVDLGMPTKVHIEHNAVGYGGGWYLDELTIQDSDKRDAEYWFPCQQWLDMGITDKQTQRELKLCGIINKNIQNISTSIEGTLDVIVVSGDIQDEGNSFDALFTICCERGDYEPVRFARGSLQQDGTCQTTVELNKDLGAIRKVRLQMDGASKGTKWFCKEVKLHHKQSNEFIEFPFLQIFTNNGKTTAELPALCTVGPILSVKTYSVYITTNQSMQLPGDTHMFITLRGSLGNSGRTTFSCKKNEFTNKTKTAGFQLECVDIGVIQELLIERENKTNLQLEKAVVGEGEFMKKKYVFAAQQWKKEKNKILSMTLRVTEVHEESGADALVYGTQPMTSDGEWDIHLMTTIQKDRQQIVESQEHSTNLFFVFYGDKGKSDPITIETNKVSQVKDLPVYKINLKNDLGELYKVRLGLEEWIETTGFLSLHHLKMKNVKTMATFNYSICQTLPLLLNGDRWIEIPVEWPLKPSLLVVTYYVHVFGTLSHDDGFEMTLCLNGKNGDTGDRRLTWQKSNNEHGNMLLTAILQAVEIGEMFHADISISSKHDCQLCIKRIHIKESSKKDIYAFDVNQELSIDANEPQRRQVLLSQVIHDNPDQKEGSIDDQVEYLIKVYTGDVIGAGTNAHVQISLFGHQDSFGPVELNQPLEHHNPFERGNVDTFKVLTHNLGRIIYIDVGHDGKGYGSGWFLDRIEITNLTTNYVTSFSYNRWLSEGEDDGSTTIQIYC